MLTDKLLFRQRFSEDESDYTILGFLAGCSLLVVLSFLPVFRSRPAIIIALLFLLQTAFTLYYESPDSHGNEERYAMNKTVAWLQSAKLDQQKIYCNHPWFFWASGANNLDTLHYGSIDSSSLKNILPGSIIIWEAHYTNKNYSNIPVDNIINDTSMSLIYMVADEDEQTRAMIFSKVASAKEGSDLFDKLTQALPNDKYVAYLKGYYERKSMKNLDASTKSFTHALALDPQYSAALYQRGVNYMMMNNKNRHARILDRQLPGEP